MALSNIDFQKEPFISVPCNGIKYSLELAGASRGTIEARIRNDSYLIVIIAAEGAIMGHYNDRDPDAAVEQVVAIYRRRPQSLQAHCSTYIVCAETESELLKQLRQTSGLSFAPFGIPRPVEIHPSINVKDGTSPPVRIQYSAGRPLQHSPVFGMMSGVDGTIHDVRVYTRWTMYWIKIEADPKYRYMLVQEVANKGGGARQRWFHGRCSQEVRPRDALVSVCDEQVVHIRWERNGGCCDSGITLDWSECPGEELALI